MDKKETIKLLKRLDVTDLGGEKVMIDFVSGKYFMLKGVANDVWDMIQEEITPAEIIAKLTEEYDVTEEICEKEVMEFLDKLKEYSFI